MGEALAKERLGAAISALPRDAVKISTKTGTHWTSGGNAKKDFSYSAVKEDIEKSLERLKLSYVDIAYLHGPNAAQTKEGVENLARLKSEGLLRQIGVCSEGHLLAEGVEEGAEALMGMFNFLNKDHQETFQQAKRKKIHVTAIAPLAQALYAEKFLKVRGVNDLWRIARAFVKNRKQYQKARAIKSALEGLDNRPPTAAALAYVLTQAFIDIACVTTTKTAHFDEMLTALAKPLDTKELSLMDGLAAL